LDGKCVTCFDLNKTLKNNICQSVCGDGLLADTEECDSAINYQDYTYKILFYF